MIHGRWQLITLILLLFRTQLSRCEMVRTAALVLIALSYYTYSLHATYRCCGQHSLTNYFFVSNFYAYGASYAFPVPPSLASSPTRYAAPSVPSLKLRRETLAGKCHLLVCKSLHLCSCMPLIRNISYEHVLSLYSPNALLAWSIIICHKCKFTGIH